MLDKINLVVIAIILYALLLFSIEKGYTSAYALPFFVLSFSFILPTSMFLLAFLPGNLSKKSRVQLVINGFILIANPFVQNKISSVIRSKLEKRKQQNEQQNNNNLVVV